MKKVIALVLQALVLLFGIFVLFMLIRLPLTEGRATDLDLISIYSDPLILFGYIASVFFFIALYKAFRLFGFIGQDRMYAMESANALKSIKNCAVIFAVLIVLAGAYIRVFHDKDDDPAGFLALCIIITFLSFSVAFAASVFEKKIKLKGNH